MKRNEGPVANLITAIRGNAKVEELITATQSGRVRLNGVYWKALLHSSSAKTLAFPGEELEVICRDGNTLIIG